MADFTMCIEPPSKCPLSHKCKRHEDSGTVVNPYRKAYFLPELDHNVCQYFWETNKTVTN